MSKALVGEFQDHCIQNFIQAKKLSMTYLRVLIANIAYNPYDDFAIAQDAGLCKLKTYHIIRSDNHEIAGSSYNFFIILRKFIFAGYLVTCECHSTLLSSLENARRFSMHGLSHGLS